MSTVVRHKTFYFPDGSVIFEVESTLYKLHKSLLLPSSVILQNMFAMPTDQDQANMGDAQEGLSDELPIRLPDPFTVEKFDHLLGWFYRMRGYPSYIGLVSILEIGSFLEMENARNFSIRALEAITLAPAVRLSLGLNFRVCNWLEPAFRELIATPTDKISHDDFILLSPSVAYLVISTQAAIRTHRLLIAFNPPDLDMHDASCKNPILGCLASWESAWWNDLARHYLHPDRPATTQDIISMLETKEITGVTTACRLRAVEVLKEHRALHKENDMLRDALTKLKSYEGQIYRP